MYPSIKLVLASILIVCLIINIGCNEDEEHKSTLVPITVVEFTDESGTRELICYTEKSVIGMLLDSSDLLFSYYSDAMAKISDKIYWAHDPNMQTEAMTWRDPRGFKVITLRDVPASIDDVVIVAYGIESFIVGQEGFLSTSSKEAKFAHVSASMNSMVRIPLVDSRLQGYGFELNENYNEQLEDAKESLSQLTEPRDEYWRLVWIFNYVKAVLMLEDVLDINTSKSEFLQWYTDRYPEVAEDGQELLNLVRKVGYKTWQKQIELFDQIIEKYDLYDELSF